jgi:hypothetical protein
MAGNCAALVVDDCQRPFEERSPDVNATAVGDREQDGVGRRDRDYDWHVLSRTYLAPFAQASVVIRRARLRRPSAQQPTASRVSALC